MGIVDCSADVQANGRKYTVRAATLPANGDQDESVEVALSGLDSAGAATECGSFKLPADSLNVVGKLISQVLSGLSTLSGRSTASPANAQAPWTKEQDEELRHVQRARLPPDPRRSLRPHDRINPRPIAPNRLRSGRTRPRLRPAARRVVMPLHPSRPPPRTP
ncbi:hypothetical protein [Kibdelosporangium aridum]|uniref:Uncharacterized protein n=1 Tax=Kibdelosporangium aridum TaxID=2030 RepID=A0A1W2EVM5_KIBAR|nr:hypothetical protein [Kibdelosporangium aridum]SMD13750.1 hypothetical protein SAMN05661093_04914 [Kibdelosporangium aridum]